MRYQTICEHCGQISAAYSHNLNKPLVRALRSFVDFYEQHRRPINLQKDLPALTKNQYNNFQKLHYFQLVYNVEDGWLPTELGIRFIYGQSGILNPAGSLNNKILPPDHEAWDTHSRDRKTVFVSDIDDFSYKQAIDYKEEKNPQGTLL